MDSVLSELSAGSVWVCFSHVFPMFSLPGPRAPIYARTRIPLVSSVSQGAFALWGSGAPVLHTTCPSPTAARIASKT